MWNILKIDRKTRSTTITTPSFDRLRILFVKTVNVHVYECLNSINLFQIRTRPFVDLSLNGHVAFYFECNKIFYSRIFFLLALDHNFDGSVCVRNNFETDIHTLTCVACKQSVLNVTSSSSSLHVGDLWSWSHLDHHVNNHTTTQKKKNCLLGKIENCV